MPVHKQDIDYVSVKVYAVAILHVPKQRGYITSVMKHAGISAGQKQMVLSHTAREGNCVTTGRNTAAAFIVLNTIATTGTFNK